MRQCVVPLPGADRAASAPFAAAQPFTPFFLPTTTSSPSLLPLTPPSRADTPAHAQLMGDSTPIGPLLQTVFEVRFHSAYTVALTHVRAAQSILEVFILCLAGYILARKGILDRTTQKVRRASLWSVQSLTKRRAHSNLIGSTSRSSRRLCSSPKLLSSCLQVRLDQCSRNR